MVAASAVEIKRVVLPRGSTLRQLHVRESLALRGCAQRCRWRLADFSATVRANAFGAVSHHAMTAPKQPR